MSKYLVLLLTLCCSFISRADSELALECSHQEMDLVDPYKHYLVRLADIRVNLTKQTSEINLDKLDSLIFDTLDSINKLGCYSDNLDNLKKLKSHYLHKLPKSDKVVILLTEMGV
ncbi:hypothetical protein [Shewanella glacialimarina]|jgi:hypothetical protein|uniref:hypothetical protein n=1 Tax=Shewanella glacialimarina TaxID=2590884 RepID=UPI001CF856EA|nr:hypothetical protein [Shewanella glacialimarina]UCX05084.1 hypothetical protein FJ709_11575 [Shewanella glacialimarina]